MVGRGGEGGAVILLRGCFWFYFPPQTVLCNRPALWRSVLLEAESGGAWRAVSGGGGPGGGGLAGGALLYGTDGLYELHSGRKV